MKKYKPKYVLLLNNGTKIIQRNWLRKMVEVAESDEKIGIVGCKLIYPDGRIQHAGVDIKNLKHRGYGEINTKTSYNQAEEIDAVTFACSLISTKVFNKIGFIDENYSPFSFEDVDFCIRTRKFFKILYLGSVSLIHNEGVSTSKLSGNLKYFYIQRNWLILFFRYFSLSVKLKEAIKTLFIRPLLTRKHLRKGFDFHKDFIFRFFLSLKALEVAIRKCADFEIQ